MLLYKKLLLMTFGTTLVYENQNSLFDFTNVRYWCPSQLHLMHRFPNLNVLLTSHIPSIILCNHLLRQTFCALYYVYQTTY